MRFIKQPKPAAIDSLCQRQCSFVICRHAGTDLDELYMQADGQSSRLSLADGLPERGGFILAPYDHQHIVDFIADECDTLPAAERFPKLEATSLRGSRSILTREEYGQKFQSFLRDIREDEQLEKRVLARCEDVSCPDFSPARAYARACEVHKRSFCALIHSPEAGTWLCATPELLIKGEGQQWQSMALAGTQQHGGTWSDKNKREQECVSQHLRDLLQDQGLRYCEQGPHTLQSANIEHLCTLFNIDMGVANLAEFLAFAPPTPAVCGYPTMLARSHQLFNPDLDRSYYAGFIGTYSPQGPSAIYVTLRCMQIAGSTCRLYAGGGILAESDEESEWQETCLKMQAMRSLIEAQQAYPLEL